MLEHCFIDILSSIIFTKISADIRKIAECLDWLSLARLSAFRELFKSRTVDDH